MELSEARDAKLSDLDFRILAVIRALAFDNWVPLSAEDIAGHLGRSQRTVERALPGLRSAGLFESRSAGHGRAMEYFAPSRGRGLKQCPHCKEYFGQVAKSGMCHACDQEQFIAAVVADNPDISFEEAALTEKLRHSKRVRKAYERARTLAANNG